MAAFDEALSKLRLSGSALLVAALIVAELWPTDAAAQSSCLVNRATFSAGIDCTSTNSTSFVNVPQTALDITVGGSVPTCVIVAFSAQTKTDPNENMNVRARIAGIGIGEPEDVTFGSGSGALEARATQFVFANVPPGSYTVHMQYRSVEAGSNVRICEPTVVVHHR
jgi:hypothetical protein